MSREIEKLKETILKEYPRLSEESEFCFKCHKNVPCFNACCGDVNIFLTPYDILRLKNRLGITSGEFLAKYTLSPFDENTKYPIILLKMEDNEKKSCPFVTDEGCSVYEDRPWPCRMYPLGLASPKDDPQIGSQEFYFVLNEDVCKGHLEDHRYTVHEWIEDQGIEPYTEMGELYKDITLNDFFVKGGQLEPKKMEMFFTACYNIDKFREFVFDSSFLQRFEVDSETQERIKGDDVEMLKFGFRWIRFAFFGEDTIQIKSEVREARKKEIEKKKPGNGSKATS